MIHNRSIGPMNPANTWDVRFRPCRWIVFRENTTTHLFVNTATGRFQRKDMPLLTKYHLGATTKGGFLVLVDDKIEPAVVFVLNPFTGHLARFMESPPSSIFGGARRAAATVFGSPPTLVLGDRHDRLHKADLDGEHVSFQPENGFHHRLIRPVIGNGVYSLMGMGCPFSDDTPGLKMFSSDQIKMLSYCDAFLVECDGKALMIVKRKNGGMDVFKVDSSNRIASESVESIGDDRAIFVGIWKCVSIVASKFSPIKGNCIYHVKYDPKLKHGKG